MTPLEIESKRFAGNVGKCWNNTPRSFFGMSICEKCGWPHDNPTYTIELIRSELGDKWEGFVIWHHDNIEKSAIETMHDDAYRAVEFWVWIFCLSDSDILTTPLYLLQAANSYMGRDAA